MAHSTKTVQAALEEYVKGILTTKEIAKKYDTSPSTLTVWATMAGLKLRSRGRRKQDEPTMRQKEMIKLAQVLKYEDVGRRYGVSKQAIHRVLRRWNTYVLPKRPPFAPGDILLWKGQKFTVYSAEITGGTLVDKGGKLVRCFTWNTGGRMPTKVGFDQRYAHSVPTQKAGEAAPCAA